MVPPAIRTSSRNPASPNPSTNPVPGGTGLLIVTVVTPAEATTSTVTGAPGACRAALVSASCTTRYAARPTAGGLVSAAASVRVTARPAARARAISAPTD